MTAQYLPARALPYPGESLTGYVRRHVTIMGYDSLRQLLSLMESVEFPPHLDQLGMGAAMTALAGLSASRRGRSSPHDGSRLGGPIRATRP